MTSRNFVCIALINLIILWGLIRPPPYKKIILAGRIPLMSSSEEFKILSDDSSPETQPTQRRKRKRPSHWRFFTELELLIIRSIKRDHMTAQRIANLMGIENNSSFRATLASMMERMILIRAKGGYRINR